MHKYNVFIKMLDGMCRRVLQTRGLADTHFHVMRKIASAVAEQTMGGIRPSSKDWIGAPRHTTTCTRNQVCLHNGKLSPVPCKVSDTQRRFLLKFQVRLLMQGIRHPEHFKTQLRR
jgi:hypothetical protein